MTKTVDIEQLKARIWAMEHAGRPTTRVASMGVAALDGALPWGGLPKGHLHQVVGDAGPAAAFTAALAARMAEAPRPVMWCLRDRSDADTLYGPGLARFGLTPDRLIVIRAGSDADLAWAMEEGLRCPGLAAVIGQIDGLSLTAARRLQLAAETGGVTGFLLGDLDRVRRAAPATTAEDIPPAAIATRWRVLGAPADPARPDAPHWHVQLDRCRGGNGDSGWFLDWDDETGNLAVASDLFD